ncbi:MAG: hypothetical protein WCF04_02575 [Candidatus Nanopelagicales bacterium]
MHVLLCAERHGVVNRHIEAVMAGNALIDEPPGVCQPAQGLRRRSARRRA